MLRDMKNLNAMNAKRRYSCVEPGRPFLMKVTDGQKYSLSTTRQNIIGSCQISSIIVSGPFMSNYHCIIKYENNQFNVYDNDSTSGTYINCKKLSSGKSNSVVLEHGDLISFGTEKNMKITFKFVFPSDTAKKQRLNTNKDAPAILTPNEKYKSELAGFYTAIRDLKVDRLVLRFKYQKLVSEFQTNLKELTKDILQYQNMHREYDELMSVQGSIESLKTQVNTLLEAHFECPICNDVMIKVSMTACNHAFCESCISQWLLKSKSCPVCRILSRKANRCVIIDNFITNVYELIGGTEKERRDNLLKEMTLIKPTVKRGRKIKGIPINQLEATRSPRMDQRTRETGVEFVDLTHNISQ